MKQIILVRYGEIALKGLNRPVFEDRLVNNIKRTLAGAGDFFVRKAQGRIYVEGRKQDSDIDEAVKRVIKVFGIVSVSLVYQVEPEMNAICDQALLVAQEMMEDQSRKSFKVASKREDKRFHLKSPEINRDVGSFLLDNIPELTVDVIKPSFIVYVEVRDKAYIYSKIIPAYGGMPVGTNSKAMLLLSGGIDSPVAGWMLAKRGVEIEAIHFYSYPYTSERAKDKVIELARIMSESCYHIKLHIIPFTEVQVAIRDSCPEDELTIIMRRVMMEIAEKLAVDGGSLALITGESVGQVASQTLQSLVCTDAAVGMPVFRPLIGMDKEEVINIARRIGTFETSILPYEDCCTIFVAKHPKTKPRLENILKSEENLSITEMVDKAILEREIVYLKNGVKIEIKAKGDIDERG